MTLYCHRIDSPIGGLGLVVDASGGVVRIAFLPDGELPLLQALERYFDGSDELTEDAERCAPLEEQLREYFAGERKVFDLPLVPRGTEFQKEVWNHLLEIPAGETTTYAAIAKRLGRPGASRAVGRANATNPIPIIVPCHRVVGSNGTLTGYAGGLEVKQGLLEIEGYARLPF